MSESTITAEGGTIRLVTAPDGSISASSADFAVAVVQQVEGGATAPTEYASVAALVTASEGSLAPGYYEVVCEWITYWDGSVFCPPPPSGEGIVTDDGTLVYQDLAAQTNTVLFLAPQPVFPGLRDYAGTYSDEELCDVPSLPARNERGLYMHYNRKKGQYVGKAALRITGDLVIRCLVRHLSAHPTTLKDFIDQGASGESEAVNFLWNVNLSRYLFDFFQERGSGVDETASWIVPQGPLVGRAMLWEFRRESGSLTAWVNGLQLQRIVANTNGTVEADGSFTVLGPTGGGDTVMAHDADFGSYAEVDLVYAHIQDAAAGTLSAAEYAAGKAAYTADELNFLMRDDFAERAMDANLVALLEPQSGGIVDLAPSPATFSPNPACPFLIGGQRWTVGNSVHTSTDAKLKIVGDMTINVLVMRGTTTDDYWVSQDTAGETEATNVLYQFRYLNSTIYYFHEHGAGVNAECTWTVDTMDRYEIREYRLVRETVEANQNLRLYERLFGSADWTIKTVASSSGSGVGTTQATITKASGGSSTRFNLNRASQSTSPIRQMAIYSAAIDP